MFSFSCRIQTRAARANMQLTIKIKRWSGKFGQFPHSYIAITLSLSISKFPLEAPSKHQITLTHFLQLSEVCTKAEKH